MKKWHMEGILSLERRGNKLQIPNPGQKTIWSKMADSSTDNEFFLAKMMRAFRQRVNRRI